MPCPRPGAVEVGCKFELAINLATTKAFGVIPPSVVALADEVIE